MTVKLLGVWGAQPANTLFTSDAVTEAAMVAAKHATLNLAGGVVWKVPGNSMNVGPAAVGAADGKTLRAGDTTFGRNVDKRSPAERLSSSFVPAPTVEPVDYLTGVKILEVGANWLFGHSSATTRTLSKYARSTYVESVPVMSPTTTFPNVTGSDVIQEIMQLSNDVLLVEVGAPTGNDIIYKVTTSDEWATCSYVPWLYLGADNPTTGAGGNARGTVGYRTLSKSNIAVDTNGDIYVGEYIGALTAAGQRIRLLKLPSGSSTWVAVWSLNIGVAEQQVRHIHCCQINPFTGALWLGTGDYDSFNSGTAGASAQDQCWTLVWDKIAPLPDATVYTTSATMVAALLASPGIELLHGEQRNRPVQYLFRPEGVYYMSDASPSQVESHQNCGIFKVDHAATVLERMYGITDESQAISGYYTVQTDSGTMVFLGTGGDNATFTSYRVPIITSRDGIDYAFAGQVQKVPDANSIPYGARFDSVSGYIFVSYDNIVGKAGTVKTLVFRVIEDKAHNKVAWDGSKIIREPETLHPVYWLDLANTSGAALDAAGPQGHSPRAPWATFAYAMQSSRMTHGGRLKVMDTATAQTTAISSLNWSANAIPGDASQPLELDLRGCDFSWGSNSYWLTWTATQHLRILGDSIKLTSAVAGSGGLFNNNAVTADSNVTFQDVRMGYLGHAAGVTAGRIGFTGRGIVKLDRSRVIFTANGELFQNAAASTGKSTFQIYDSAIDECATLVNDQRTDTDYDYQNSWMYARLRPWTLANAGAATGAFRIQNSAVFTGATSGNYLFTGTGKPAAFAQDPFRNCVVNYAWTTAIDAITITAPEWFVTNVKSVAPLSYEKTGHIPRDPASGDWRDERYVTVGPRVKLLGDSWLSGAPL